MDPVLSRNFWRTLIWKPKFLEQNTVRHCVELVRYLTGEGNECGQYLSQCQEECHVSRECLLEVLLLAPFLPPALLEHDVDRGRRRGSRCNRRLGGEIHPHLSDNLYIYHSLFSDSHSETTCEFEDPLFAS